MVKTILKRTIIQKFDSLTFKFYPGTTASSLRHMINMKSNNIKHPSCDIRRPTKVIDIFYIVSEECL